MREECPEGARRSRARRGPAHLDRRRVKGREPFFLVTSPGPQHRRCREPESGEDCRTWSCAAILRGCVISGVADHPDRVGALIYPDSFELEDGQSCPTLCHTQRICSSSSAAALGRLEGAADSGPKSSSQCGESRVGETASAPAISGDFPTVHQVEGDGGRADTGPVRLATGWNDSPFPVFYDRARARGWKTVTIPCGHDVMLDRPEELTRVLLDVIEAQPAAI